ncbi:hypothetical protein DFA_01181 [Cavenderia fasciculata]|uniref:Pleckstrin domain-containing protein n=1 Tax=Cavenderia fasciculata TaxID=261658 RepID=F4PRA0_CACFS|nr:uncharacterized protein DFA_01181 [Cavenderia fasciculata]EGG21300.1 hypothetical protein DFA_01181 [Cavenderia fasciculata]|eukprot:XP_004359150.1 hypothetical protein DFA_01181 [Cavenderia fasciculata]
MKYLKNTNVSITSAQQQQQQQQHQLVEEEAEETNDCQSNCGETRQREYSICSSIGEQTDEEQYSNHLDEMIKNLLLKRENKTCSDCGSPDPVYASIYYKVIICSGCAVIHRKCLKSKVQSINLSNEWSLDEYQSFSNTNNMIENESWEKYLPLSYIKPTFGDSSLLKENWILTKYIHQSFTSEKNLSKLKMDLTEGWIVKKGKVVKNWKKRWLRLCQVGDKKKLNYYRGPTETTACGSIDLCQDGGAIQIDCINDNGKRTNCFVICTSKRRYLISCPSQEEMFRWIQLIRSSTNYYNQFKNIPQQITI